MKKAVFAVFLAVMLLSVFSTVAFAEKPENPGVWRTHFALLGVEDGSGALWGETVSGIAQSGPAAIPLAHGRGPVGK